MLALLNHDNRLEQSLQRSSFNINSIECTALQLLTTLYFFLGLHQQLNIHFIYMLLMEMYMLHTRTHVYIIFSSLSRSIDRVPRSLYMSLPFIITGGEKRRGVSFFFFWKKTFHSVKIILRAERSRKMHVTEIYLPVINKVWFHQLFSFYQLSKASHKLLKLLLTTRKKNFNCSHDEILFQLSFHTTQSLSYYSFKTGWLVCRVKFSLLTMLEPWNLLPPTYPQAVKNLPSSSYP